MHLLTCYRSKFTIAAATLRRNPVLANTKQIVATAVPNTIGTQLIVPLLSCVPFLFPQLGLEKYPVDLIAYQWMGNHWHNLAPDTFFSPYKKRVGQVSLLTQFFSFLKPQEPFFCEVKCSPINLLSGRENELFSNTKNSFVCRYFLVRHKQLQWSIRYRRKPVSYTHLTLPTIYSV